MQQKTRRKYVVVFDDGPMNGGERYFCTLSAAKKCGFRYVARSQDYPERVSFDVYFIDDRYCRHHIYCSL